MEASTSPDLLYIDAQRVVSSSVDKSQSPYAIFGRGGVGRSEEVDVAPVGGRAVEVNIPPLPALRQELVPTVSRKGCRAALDQLDVGYGIAGSAFGVLLTGSVHHLSTIQCTDQVDPAGGDRVVLPVHGVLGFRRGFSKPEVDPLLYELLAAVCPSSRSDNDQVNDLAGILVGKIAP